MVCEFTPRNELSLSDFIKILYEFDDIEKLVRCVENLKETMTLDEVKNLSDEEMFRIFMDA